jgi:hypothetical protein
MTPFRTALIAGSWRCGSTVLNRSLMQHSAIFGWNEESDFYQKKVPVGYIKPVNVNFEEELEAWCRHAGWQGQSWVLHKNPQAALKIAEIMRWCPPERVLLLTRNPYAICRSLLEPPFSNPPYSFTIEKACLHLRAYYTPLLMLESTNAGVRRVRYENFIADPKRSLTDLLQQVFELPFEERCLSWEKKAVRLGVGDPKISDTQAWKGEGADVWRVGLTSEQKDYVRAYCLDIFEALDYDPKDA